MFPQNHIFLFTENEPIYTLPFSILFSFNRRTKNSHSLIKKQQGAASMEGVAPFIWPKQKEKLN